MASVWGELKRRNVVRVAVAYVVVSWLILQLTDILIPMLTLPEWVGRLVFLLLLVGFPLALFFAWAFELTPEGLKKEKDVDRSESITHVTGRKLDFVIIAVLVVAVGFLLADKIFLGEDDTVADEIIATERQSIAVLPFMILSSNQDDEFFSDGLTEELLNSLAQISSLDVAGRTSSFYYKGKTPSFQEVGEALGVAHVLEGSVRRAGNQLRITTQLIKVDDGFHLWSATYDRTLDDIFAIQEDIALQVTDALKVTLFGDEAESLRQHGTSNAEAQSLYLIAKARLREGQAFLADTEQNPQHLRSARRLLEEVVRLDPEFAEAWAALARAYMSVTVASLDASGESLSQPDGARLSGEALERALALAPDLPEAQLAKAQWHVANLLLGPDTLAEVRTRVAAAIEAFEKSLRLAPNSAEALEAYALLRNDRGEYKAAISLFDRAIALDPHSQAHLHRARSLYWSGRTSESVREYKRIGQLYPDVPWKAGIAEIEFNRGHLHHGILWAENAPEIFAVPFAWASLGDKDRLREFYEVLRRRGGSFASLVSVEEMFLARDYLGVTNWFDERGNSASFVKFVKMSMPWIAAVYLRDRPDALNKLELWLVEFPTLRESLWGSPAAREFVTELRVEELIRQAMYGIYVAYTLNQAGHSADANVVESWSEEQLNMSVPRGSISEFALLHSRALLAGARGQTEEALAALEALVNAGWRQTMSPLTYYASGDYGGDLAWFEDSPLLDSIRDEPRFRAVVEKVNAANAAMLAELNAGLTLEDIMDEEFE